MHTQVSQSKIIGVVVFLALVWGSSFILMKKGLDAFTPFEIATLRMSIAGICFLPIVIRSFSRLSQKELMVMPILGIVGNGVPAILFPLAETKINSATAGMLNSLTPMFTLLIGVIAFEVAFSWRKTTGILVGFLGAVLLMLMGKHAENSMPISLQETILYASFIVIATMMYGLNVNLMKRYLNGTPAILISAFSLLSIAVPYLIYLLFFSQIPEKIQTHPNGLTSLGYLAMLAILGTTLSNILFYRLVQWTDAVVSSSVTYLMPIVALAWGFLLQENINLWQILGMAIILLGVYLVNKKD